MLREHCGSWRTCRPCVSASRLVRCPPRPVVPPRLVRLSRHVSSGCPASSRPVVPPRRPVDTSRPVDRLGGRPCVDRSPSPGRCERPVLRRACPACVPWRGGAVGRLRPLRAGPQPGADDAGRHQHLGAGPPRGRTGAGGRSRPGRRGHLRRGAARPPGARVPGGRRPAHPRPPRPQRRAPGGSPSWPGGRGAGALDPAHRLGVRRADRRGRRDAGDLELRVVATPGHSGDSLCFVLPAAAGAAHRGHRARPRHHRGRPPRRTACPTTWPRCARLEALCADGGGRRCCPGHGPVLAEPAAGRRPVLPAAPRRTAGAGARGGGRRGREPRGRSSSGSTPTWIGRCGPPPSSASGLSWSTSERRCRGRRGQPLTRGRRSGS